MARSKAETDELLLAVMEWTDADPHAALIVATINDGTHECGALVTLGHAGCTTVSLLTMVAELLDFAEEQLLAFPGPLLANRSLERVRASRAALGATKAPAMGTMQ